MVWFKVDDSFADHVKVLAAGNTAIGLWVRCGAYASKHLTDGYVPGSLALMYGTAAEVEHLVAAGLWDVVDNGYQMHDFTEYNPHSDSVVSKRRATAERVKKWREEHKNREITAVGNAVTNAPPDPTRPDPSSKEEGVAARKRATRIPDPFLVNGEMRKWAAEEVPGLDVTRATRQFVDYWRAASGRTAAKLDWIAAWRNWMRKDWAEHPPPQAPQSLRDRYAGVRRLDD